MYICVFVYVFMCVCVVTNLDPGAVQIHISANVESLHSLSPADIDETSGN